MCFSNYPAFKRACRQNNCLLHLSSKIQRSQVSAFHVSYRISLRSSSIHDPSDPPFRVILFCLVLRTSVCIANSFRGVGPRAGFLPPKRSAAGEARPEPGQASIAGPRTQATSGRSRAAIKNDPSAGSPTETLLRLLVPPVDQVCHSSSLIFRPCDLPTYKSKRLTKPTSRY